MASLDDKKAFSERLTQALKRSGRDATSATQLAMQFNLRHPNEPITAQAAQKWLTGKAKPTTDKIETLAAWLNVSPEWLRLGFIDIVSDTYTFSEKQIEEHNFTAQDIKFFKQFKTLSDYQQRLIVDIVEQLVLERKLRV